MRTPNDRRRLRPMGSDQSVSRSGDRRLTREPSFPEHRAHTGEARRPRRGSYERRDAFATVDTRPGTGLDELDRDRLDHESTARSGCVVYVVDGESQDRGQYLTLHTGTLTIGKSRSCDLTLADPRVSRCHIELSMTRDGIRVQDRDSTNGTYYLGGRVSDVTVLPGSQLRLGRTTISLLPNSDGDGIALDPLPHYGRMLGTTAAMRRIFALMRMLESSEAPVLIKGELGTGRRLAAETLHERSPRARGRMVTLDCEATPQDEIDAVLFGHAAGALSNATSDRIGLIEQAHGGTLVLLNVDAMPLGVQTRLVRAIETRRLRRLGDEVARPFDVRLLSTARGDLGPLIDAGDFKDELARLLSVVSFTLPPLRDRADDVPILAQKFAKSFGTDDDPLPQPVLDRLAQHEWSGNVSELREVVCHLRQVSDIEEALAPRRAFVHRSAVTPIDPSVPFEAARQRALEDFECAYLRALLERCDGDLSVAAKDAGVPTKSFRELLARHGL